MFTHTLCITSYSLRIFLKDWEATCSATSFGTCPNVALSYPYVTLFPVGHITATMLTSILSLKSVYFQQSLPPSSYFDCLAYNFAFLLTVFKRHLKNNDATCATKKEKTIKFWLKMQVLLSQVDLKNLLKFACVFQHLDVHGNTTEMTQILL